MPGSYRPGDGTPMGAVLELVNQINRVSPGSEVETTVWLNPDGPPEADIDLYDEDGLPLEDSPDLTLLEGEIDRRALARLIAERLVRSR